MYHWYSDRTRLSLQKKGQTQNVASTTQIGLFFNRMVKPSRITRSLLKPIFSEKFSVSGGTKFFRKLGENKRGALSFSPTPCKKKALSTTQTQNYKNASMISNLPPPRTDCFLPIGTAVNVLDGGEISLKKSSGVRAIVTSRVFFSILRVFFW